MLHPGMDTILVCCGEVTYRWAVGNEAMKADGARLWNDRTSIKFEHYPDGDGTGKAEWDRDQLENQT